MAQAWVLIFGLGYNWAFTVPGIYSEESCFDLAKRIQQEWKITSAPDFKCFTYDPSR